MTLVRHALIVFAFVWVAAVSAGAAAGPAPVRHAVIVEPPVSIDLWQDTRSDETALRVQGDTTVTIMRGRVLLLVEDGVLTEHSVYPTAGLEWRRIHEQYGVTARQAAAALAAGSLVPRPALMDPPRPRSNGTNTYQIEVHFGTNVAKLRRAAHFWVPSPGLTLLGLKLADASLMTVLGPSRAVSGPLALVDYSADPAREGTGEHDLFFNVTPATSRIGQEDAAFYRKSRNRISGPGYQARFVNNGEPLFRHEGSYILIVPQNWTPTPTQWRVAVARAIR